MAPSFARAFRIACQIFGGVSGMSMWAMPNGASASITALATAAVDAIAPASPAPFTPSGLTGDGVTVRSSSNAGSWSAFGTAYSMSDAVRSWPFLS